MAIDGLGGPEEYPALFEALRNRGYGDADLRAIAQREPAARAAPHAAGGIPMTVLLTGFPRYADAERNPSEQIVAELDATMIGGAEIAGRMLPVSAERTPGAVRAAIAETAPSLILCLGVAPGRAGLSIERTAVNLFDFHSPDNDGAQPVDVADRGGRAGAYFATLPLRQIVEAWRVAGIPGYVSDTAGLYLCNAAMYTALHATAAGGHRRGSCTCRACPKRWPASPCRSRACR